jgi:hypothetical protein
MTRTMESERLHGRMHKVLMLPSVKNRCVPSVRLSIRRKFKAYQSMNWSNRTPSPPPSP